MYYRHTGYPGGLKTRSFNEMIEKAPEDVIKLAVKGMLPTYASGSGHDAKTEDLYWCSASSWCAEPRAAEYCLSTSCWLLKLKYKIASQSIASTKSGN